MSARAKAAGLLVVAVVAVLVYSLAFSGGDDSTTSAEQSVVGTPSIAPPADPRRTTADSPTAVPTAEDYTAEDVARQGLTVAFTWYPGTDTTQNDAYGRARQWLTDKLSDQMSIDASTERGPSVQWGQWSQQQAKVVADVSIACSGCPEDTDTVIRRVATIKQTAITDAGTDTVEPDTTVWVTLVRHDEGWLIDEIRY